MGFKFGARSEARFVGVHPDLVRVFRRAITLTPIDFSMLEGLRTLKRQKQLFAAHATTTMNSRHLTGHAMDAAPVVGGVVRWDWPLYYKLADVIKEAARIEHVPIEWGGDWRRFKDGPHWQLPFGAYPK